MRRHLPLARRVLVFALLLLVAVPALLWLAERRSNPNLDSPADSQIWLVRTVFEDGTPYGLFTLPGYLIFFAVTLLGIGVVGVFTGAVSGRITGAVTDKRTGTGVSTEQGHLLICGWNTRAREIVAALGHGSPDRRIPVVLLAPLDCAPAGLRDVEFVRGDPTDDGDLCRAGAHRAATAVVLADATGTTDPGERDARTLLAVLSVEALNPTCHTVAEVVRPTSRALFGLARCDEIVDGPSLTGSLLATAAAQEGVAELIVDLVGARRREAFHSVAPPRSLVGRPFREALAAMKESDDLLVVGLARDGQVTVNPDGDRLVEPGDELLVLR